MNRSRLVKCFAVSALVSASAIAISCSDTNFDRPVTPEVSDIALSEGRGVGGSGPATTTKADAGTAKADAGTAVKADAGTTTSTDAGTPMGADGGVKTPKRR